MKTILKSIILVSVLIVLISCEEDFNTDAEFRERFVLTSLINCDTSMQVAFVTKTYDAGRTGLNPDLESLFIHGADLKVWYDYNVYQYRDTTIFNENNDPLSFYYITNLKPEERKVIEIEALLPNGLLLQSITTVPDIYHVKFSGSDLVIPPRISKKTIDFNWTNIGNNVYDPRLKIIYLYIADTGAVRMEKLVPIDFVVDGSKITPVFPQPSNIPGLTLKMSAFSKTMEQISEGENNKSKFVVLMAELQLMIYDEALAAHFSSINQFLDQFSVSLDTPDFSNVNGGLGIFGSYISKKLLIEVDKDYIRSFNYGTGQ
jgi:hypothetical protein